MLVSRTRFFTTVGLFAFLLIAGTFLALGQHGGVQAVAPAADAMSIDMDTTGNTASSIGTRDECVSVAAGSTVTVDVTIDRDGGALPMLWHALRLEVAPVREGMPPPSVDLSALSGAEDTHALLNTDTVNGVESCTVCHSDSDLASVSNVHMLEP